MKKERIIEGLSEAYLEGEKEGMTCKSRVTLFYEPERLILSIKITLEIFTFSFLFTAKFYSTEVYLGEKEQRIFTHEDHNI